MSDLFFAERFFPNLGAIKEYLRSLERTAQEAHTEWSRALADPISQFSHLLDSAYARDRLKDTNHFPLYITPEVRTREIRISSDLLHRNSLERSTDYMDVCEVRANDGGLLRAEIRMKYPLNPGGIPPPWEQEVYLLVMKPTRSDGIYHSENGVDYTPLYDGDVDIPQSPHASVQTSLAFLQWEKAQNIVPSEIGGFIHIFHDPRIAKPVFLHGIEQLRNVLKNPHTVCESYEFPPLPEGTKVIPLSKRIKL